VDIQWNFGGSVGYETLTVRDVVMAVLWHQYGMLDVDMTIMALISAGF
jgi:hypothetical protein